MPPSTVSIALAPIAWILLPLFAAGVAAATRRRSVAQGDAWPLVGLGAAIMQNCLFGGVVATQAVLVAGGLSADVEWGVWQLHTAFFSLNAVSLAIIMASLSLAGARTGLIRGWHAGLGFVSAAVMTVVSVTTPLHMDGGPLGLLGLVGFLGWVVWLATYGVVLLRVPSDTAAADGRPSTSRSASDAGHLMRGPATPGPAPTSGRQDLDARAPARLGSCLVVRRGGVRLPREQLGEVPLQDRQDLGHRYVAPGLLRERGDAGVRDAARARTGRTSRGPRRS